jgi:ankyrin repeat protein
MPGHYGKPYVQLQLQAAWSLCSCLWSDTQLFKQPGLGFNPIIVAAYNGHKPVVKYFKQQGAHLNNGCNTPFSARTPHDSCLEASAAGGHVVLLYFVLSQGKHSHRQLLQAVVAAAKHGQSSPTDFGTLNVLMEELRMVDLENCFATASAAGHTGAMHMLLTSGADVDIDRYAFHPGTYLGEAISSQQWDVVRLLVQHGAKAGAAALRHAIRSDNSVAACKVLLQCGVKDHWGQAIHTAAKRGQLEIVQMLLASGQPEAKTTGTFRRYRAALRSAAAGSQLHVVQALIQGLKQHIGLCGQRVIVRSSIEAAVIAHAGDKRMCSSASSAPGSVRCNHADIVNLLHQQYVGKDFSMEQELWEVQENSNGKLELLAEWYAVVNLRKLIKASKSGSPENVARLLDDALEEQPVDRDGSAVMCAAKRGNTSVLHLLLQHGANAAAAYRLAVLKGDKLVIEVLTGLDPSLMPALRATELELAIQRVSAAKQQATCEGSSDSCC